MLLLNENGGWSLGTNLQPERIIGPRHMADGHFRERTQILAVISGCETNLKIFDQTGPQETPPNATVVWVVDDCYSGCAVICGASLPCLTKCWHYKSAMMMTNPRGQQSIGKWVWQNQLFPVASRGQT